MTTRAKQILALMADGQVRSTVTIAKELGMSLALARRTVDYLNAENLINSQPVVYKMTEAGLKRAAHAAKRVPRAKAAPMVKKPPEKVVEFPHRGKRMTFLAMSMQPNSVFDLARIAEAA